MGTVTCISNKVLESDDVFGLSAFTENHPGWFSLKQQIFAPLWLSGEGHVL